MARLTKAVTDTLAGIFLSANGLPSAIRDRAEAENLYLAELAEDQIVKGNIAADAAAEAMAQVPVFRVYCDRVVNHQREKFRRFSGTVRAVVEIWMSQERSDDLSGMLEVYTEAVTDVLEKNRGDWGQGITYGGNYEVQFQNVRTGGRNYLQMAKVTIETEVSQPMY